MNILINASNIKKGGGLQVADSFLKDLYKYRRHHFVVVYPKMLEACAEGMSKYDNIECFLYDMTVGFRTFITGRDLFLDDIVEEKNINAVLTIFGPSGWKPRVPHVCGFARAQVVLNDSPYWEIVGLKTRLRYLSRKTLLRSAFRKSGKALWAESNYISFRLKDVFPDKRIYTVTNNYNQVFDHPEEWNRTIVLPRFDGITLLTISSNYPHKNLGIIIPTIHYLKDNYPDVNFRFVLTISESEFSKMSQEDKMHVIFLGPVMINQCPYLYEQSDVMFLPTLMECFSAGYAEAMRMEKPILTTNLGFARAICGNAAEYYDAVSPQELAKSIVRLAYDEDYYQALVRKGKEQLRRFDSFEERGKKLIDIVEREYQIQKNGDN